MENRLMESSSEDYSLIDRFLAGDEEGFELLVKKYQDYVLNVIYSLVGNIQQADDIAQEVFIKVYKNIGSFKKEAKFSSWLYRITLNTTYSVLKNKKRYVCLDAIQEISDDTHKHAREVLERKEKQQLVQEAIQGLPFKYRSVIILKEIEGLSYEDIAETLGCSIGTVESRLFRARAILKQRLCTVLNKE